MTNLSKGEPHTLTCIMTPNYALERAVKGWRHVRTKGSHRQFRHSVKPGTITVAGKPSIDVPPGTLNSIPKSAGLEQQQ
jgi:predicted RNA binding protein YcfA (HicA-like mRNA interferase family)